MAKTRFVLHVVSLVAAVAIFFGLGTGHVGIREARADSRTDFLISRLKADDFRVRTSAALQLGATGDEVAVQPLCSTLADANDVVRQAAGAALLRLAKPSGAGCVKDRLAVESSPAVKAQLEKTLAGLQGGGGGGGGGGGDTPADNPNAKFYVAISPISNNSGRSQDDIDRIVRAAIVSKLNANGSYQLAPSGEGPDAAKAAIAKKHLTGFYLSVQVDKFDYSNGGLRVKVKLAVFSYPGKALKGEVPMALSESGVSPGSTSDENELMQAAAERATDSFASNFH